MSEATKTLLFCLVKNYMEGDMREKERVFITHYFCALDYEHAKCRMTSHFYK